MDLIFPKLFEPGYIGKVRIKNRIIKAATYTGFAAPGGFVTNRMAEHYRELAAGGTGLIIVEMAYVDDIASAAWPNQLGAANLSHVPGLSWLATVIKESGAKACLQISHCGGQRRSGLPPVKAVSRIPSEGVYMRGTLGIGWRLQYGRGYAPQEITFEEIQDLIKDFGDAALRAKTCGFDMVEFHACHGYLLSSFLSPSNNMRNDWYGGSLNNRMRVLLQIVEDVQEKCGSDYPISVRLNGSDYMTDPPGIEIEETIEVAEALEKAGVHTIHVSGGTVPTIHKLTSPSCMPSAIHAWASEAIKRVVTIPVVASGAITTPEIAEGILKERKCDFVGLARPLLADPYWPEKAKLNRLEDINSCIRCCDGCFGRRAYRGQVSCTTNVRLGREDEPRIEVTAKAKKVVVVGGGPSGLEAARVAALSGHQVTLYEKRKLGGWLIEASVPEFKADFRNLLSYQYNQIRKFGVNIIEKEATIDNLSGNHFEAIIVATGSTPAIPRVRGTEKSIVLQAVAVLGGARTGQNIIVVGGGSVGCETALYLAEQGKRVTLIEMRDAIATDFDSSTRGGFFEKVRSTDLEICVNTKLEEITDGGIIASDRSGRLIEFQCESVILAVGMRANDGLIKALENSNLEFTPVGDCVEPRSLYDAVHEGHTAGRCL